MNRTYSYDSKMQLSDGLAAYTASGVGQVASANAVVNLGGSPTALSTEWSVLGLIGGLARIDAVCVINISAITNTTDGQYRLSVMGSNASSLTYPIELAGQSVGLGSTLPDGTGTTLQTDVAGTGSTTTPGYREILFTNEQNGIIYQYIFLYVACLGSTSKSITLTGFIAVLPLE